MRPYLGLAGSVGAERDGQRLMNAWFWREVSLAYGIACCAYSSNVGEDQGLVGHHV